MKRDRWLKTDKISLVGRIQPYDRIVFSPKTVLRSILFDHYKRGKIWFFCFLSSILFCPYCFVPSRTTLRTRIAFFVFTVSHPMIICMCPTGWQNQKLGFGLFISNLYWHGHRLLVHNFRPPVSNLVREQKRCLRLSASQMLQLNSTGSLCWMSKLCDLQGSWVSADIWMAVTCALQGNGMTKVLGWLDNHNQLTALGVVSGICSSGTIMRTEPNYFFTAYHRFF